jgi:diguanylate cyclase (GGDEF)-like protein
MRSSQLPSAEAEAAAESPEQNGRTVERSLRRRFVEAARRAAIIGLVNAASSEEDLARRFIDELCEVFDAELACLLDGGDERRSARAISTVGLSLDAAGGLLKRPEYLRSLDSDRAVLLSGEDLLGIGARGAMVAPFHTEDGRPVVVVVARLHEAPFNETDRAMLEAVTVAGGQALERIWAYEARNRSAKEQAALLRAAKSMGSSLEFGHLMNTVAEEVSRALDSDAVICALGDEVDGYVVMGQTGLPEDFLGFRQPPGTGLGGRTVEAGRTMVTQRYDEEGFAPPETTALDNLRAGVAVPLGWGDRIRGFITAGFFTYRRITAGDIELLEGFAELAGLACANAERHAEVRHAAEIDGLTGCLNRDGLQRALLGLISEAESNGTRLSVAILDLDGFKSVNDVFGHPTGDGVLKGVGAALRSSVRGGDVVARYGGDEFALILPDASEPQAAPVLDRVRASISSLEVPGGRITACVGVAERSEGESMQELITRADDALREAKGSLSPGSVRRASRSTSPLRASTVNGASPDRRQRWRAVAGDIGLGVARESDSGISAAVAVTELQDVLQLELCAVLQLVSSGRLEVIAEAGPATPSAQSRDADDGSIGRALREKRRVKGGSSQEVAVPLIVGGRAWGAVSCVAGQRPLDDVDAELIAGVAEHLSAAIRTGDLYEQLTKSMIGTAEALAAALEAKDSYTADHARSIADLAVDVGSELNLSESAIDDLRYGGIFHDVGKIAIPDALINKPGPLTDEEFEVIKQHPAIGAEILAPVPFLYGVRTIVRHAHEHWDGSGYPEGLTGQQIPLGARIVLAVDAYHAMTSDRPYRQAMSHEEACKELEDNAGSQFDPEVVQAVLAVLGRREPLAVEQESLPTRPSAAAGA